MWRGWGRVSSVKRVRRIKKGISGRIHVFGWGLIPKTLPTPLGHLDISTRSASSCSSKGWLARAGAGPQHSAPLAGRVK